jgi:DNA replication protein DnaC
MSADLQDILEKMQGGIERNIQGQFEVDDAATEPPPPTCATCQDTGYVRYDVHYTHPMFGKMFHCPEPDCAAASAHRRQQAANVMKHSTWNNDYADMTFETFWALLDSMGDKAWDGKRGAYSAANMFAISNGAAFTLNEASMHVLSRKWPGVDDRPSNCVVLTGDVGLGKTGLEVATANLLRAQEKTVVLIRLMDLVKSIQETYRDNELDSTSDRYRFYSTVPFLLIDEFGIKNYTSDRREIVETVVRARDRAGLPTMYTTNLSLEEISDAEVWDKQIGDILKKAHWVQMGGVKLRQTREKAETW